MPHHLLLRLVLVPGVIAAITSAVFAAGPAVAVPPAQSFWALSGNSGTNPTTNFVGTIDNKALNFRVNNQRAFRLEPGAFPNVIGGFSGNSVGAGIVGATIAGGGGTGCEVPPGVFPNTVMATAGTVSGGLGNTVGGPGEGGTVGGGCHNTAVDQL